MSKFIWFVLTCCTVNLYGQIIVSPSLLGGLPTEIQESSGLLIQSPDTLWSHNDSGNGSKVYAFNNNGDKLVERKFDDLSNKDWEELTKDDKGHIYLADFGNNFNDREDLLILRFTSGFQSKKDPLVVDSILFKYEDQFFFPPPASSLNFDCEAMVVMNDTIFLFTKDRSNPYKSQTLMYCIPALPGTHIAKYKASFNTLVPLFLQGSITGAALSQDKTKLLLLGYLRMWLFENFTGSNFFNGKMSIFQFEDYSQKEAVAFLDDCTVYLTDEVNNTLFNGGKLYSINLCSYLNTVENKPLKAVSGSFNSSTGSLKINFKGKIDELIIFDGKGIMIKSIKPLETDSKQFFLGYEIIPGLYTFTISSGKRKYSGKILIN